MFYENPEKLDQVQTSDGGDGKVSGGFDESAH